MNSIVSKAGCDTNPGTKEAPFLPLKAAQTAVRQNPVSSVIVPGGVCLKSMQPDECGSGCTRRGMGKTATSDVKVGFTVLRTLVLFLFILSLCACTGEERADPGIPDLDHVKTETSAVPLILCENGETQYTLVRSDTAKEPVVSAVAELYRFLKDRIGTAPVIAEDFVMRNESPDNDKPEILIGSTIRSQSIAKLAELASRDYYVGFSDDGQKFLLIGGSDEATIQAIEYFTEKIEPELSDGSAILNSVAAPYTSRHSYTARPNHLADSDLADFEILYTSTEECNASAAAEELARRISEQCGVLLPVSKLGQSREQKRLSIIVGIPADEEGSVLSGELKAILDYSLMMKNGTLYLSGKSDLSLRGAVNALIDEYISVGKDIPDGMKLTGNALGTDSVFEKTEGSNLRIMTNNVWDCDSNQPGWKKIGEDCSAKNRAIGFSSIYMSYRPDVINFQEMSPVMVQLILKDLKNSGVNYSLLSFAQEETDNTCLIYNPETVTLENSGHHIYAYGSNNNSKGYTWGHFSLNATGEHFISLSTHLWWKSESQEKGSDILRRRQCEEIVAVVKQLTEKFDCPVFVQGDLNMSMGSTPFDTLTDGGLENCWKLASVRADNTNGYHTCSPDGFSYTLSSGTYEEKSVDHMLIYNLKASAEILTFDHVFVDFYAKLSDHYPLYIDAVLGK